MPDTRFLTDIQTIRKRARERIAIDSYKEMTDYAGQNDPTTRRMLEGILAVEEEHAEDHVEPAREVRHATGRQVDQFHTAFTINKIKGIKQCFIRLL